MSSLVPSLRHPYYVTARALFRLVQSLACLAILPGAALAQINLTHTDDASPIPQGMLRVRVTTGWTRFDERFSSAGTRPLGDELSTDSLGPRQFPALIAVEQGLRALANDPRVRLSLGQLAAVSDARVATLPLALELGVTRRLSVGVLIPFVQTRQAISLKVNADSTRLANVGFVPVRSRQAAAQLNNAVYTAFKSAADSLAKLLVACPMNPTATGCAAVNANTADAAAALAQARAYAIAVQTSLGTDSLTALIAPKDQSALALAIDAQRVATNAMIQKYLGANAGASAGVFTSTSDFSYIDLQGRNGVPGLLQSTLGGGLDSIRTINRFTTGDISVGAQYLVFDTFRRDTLPARGTQTRLAVGASYRFATSFLDSTKSSVGIQTGDGAGVEVRSALDLISGKLGSTIAARFVKSFPRTMRLPLIGDPEAAFPAPLYGSGTRQAGSVLSLELTPRYLLDDLFTLDLHYGLERTGPNAYVLSTPGTLCLGCDSVAPYVPSTTTRTAQRIGLGLRYSTVEPFLRGASKFPVEVSFTHLQTISGDAGVPNISRDQIQLRMYFQLLGGR